MLDKILEDVRPTSELESSLLSDLQLAVERGHVDAFAWRKELRIGVDLQARARSVRGLREAVYDLLDDREAALPAREARLLAHWFLAASEATLGEEKRQLDAMLDSVDDELFLSDRRNRLVYANRAGMEAIQVMVGRDEIRAKTPNEEQLPAQFAQLSSVTMAAVLAGRTATVETRFPTVDGPWREHQVRPVYGLDGKIEAAVVASRDINARKTAEARLELLEKVGALAESMKYENIADAIARLAIPQLADWCVIDVIEDGRPRRVALIHRDAAKIPLVAELLATSPALRATPDKVRSGRAAIVAPDPGLARSMLIVPFPGNGGMVALARFVFASESVESHHPGDLFLVEELARRVGPIIENARLHQKLAESERRFRLALQHTRVAIFEEDTSSRSRFHYNPEEGTSGEHLEGRRSVDEIPAQQASELARKKQELLATGQAFRMDLQPRPDQHTIVHYGPLRDAHGKIVGFIGASVNVTEERKIQKELAESLAFREQMMGVLGHDLRNPLWAVRGFADLLLMRDDLPAGTRETLQLIVEASRRMNELINTLLDFTHSRFCGSLGVKRGVMDLAEVTRNVIEELRAGHPHREIRLEAPERLNGEWDAGRLAQVISNLVGNALTHGAPDTPVEVSLSRADAVILSVSNRGTPIPPEAQTRIFEAFRRSGDDAAGKPRGLGLGLFIAREIVAAHGGCISVESDSSATVFRVRL
jgi:PAS domain S-box-containing protein